jgi:carbon monoxide dehydrogenase subunit G
MACLSLTKRIAAPLETVFAVTTDLEHAAEHIRGIEKIELISRGPIGVGTQWRETRKMMGHQSTETLEVKSFDPPHGYAIGCDSCGAYIETTFRFTPVGNETAVTLEVSMETRSLFAKLMSPIGNLMFGATMRK